MVRGGRPAQQERLQARSQTASAVNRDAVFDALLHQAGVMRFDSGDELFQAAELFERQPLPRGREIGIVSNSPEVAMLVADVCATRRLDVSIASDAQNPMVLGVGAGPGEYGVAVRDLILDAGIDAVLASYVDHHGGDPEEVLSAISGASLVASKPVVASVVRADGRLPPRTGSGVPNFLFPESCVAALARAADRRSWLSRPLGERPSFSDIDGVGARTVIDSFFDREPGGGWLSLAEAESLLATHGIPFAESHQCRELDDALVLTTEMGRPVALKADFPPPAHASEIHAILLGLDGTPAVSSGWRELQRQVQAAGRRWHGAIIQSLAEPGADVLVGAFNDPDLGAVVGIGLGGRQAALGQSTEFRLPPRTDVEADDLIDACEGVRLELDGFGRVPTLDRDALRELILRFSLLLRELPELVEADLNSVRCTTTGCLVLDVRVRLERPSPVERVKTW